jgi:hypothetical protein
MVGKTQILVAQLVEYLIGDLEIAGSSRAKNLLTKQDDNTY